MFGWLKRKTVSSRDEPRFPKESLTIRILANVDDVDPEFDTAEDIEKSTIDLPPVEFVEKEFIDRVGAMLCIEGENTLQWLTSQDIATWPATSAELFNIALENLNRKSLEAELHTMRRNEVEVAHAVICEGVTLSSLVLAKSLLPRLGFANVEVAVAIPNRDCFLFCEKRSDASCDYLRQLVDVWWEDEDCPKKYRITKSLLVSSDIPDFGWIPMPVLH
jgi:hypothetical protein